jgi:hypothetical protein
MTENEVLVPRHVGCFQLSLFPSTLDEFTAEVLVSADEMRSWHGKGWLSFDPSAVLQYEEGERCEVFFIRGLARSGMSDAMINRILSAGLERPYVYDPSTTYYSFCQNRWIGLPLAPDPADVTREYIDELVREEEWLVLFGLQDRIAQVLATAVAHQVDDAVESPGTE